MTTNDFRPGDRVSIMATVVRDNDWDLVAISIDGLGSTKEYEVLSERLTLVERPEPKVSIEISLEAINKICEAVTHTGCYEGSAWDLADNIRTEIMEKLYGND